MNMEEIALITNITTILAKDLVADQKNNLRKPIHFLYDYNNERNGGCSGVPLLESEDDDEGDLRFYLKRQGSVSIDNTNKNGKRKKTFARKGVFASQHLKDSSNSNRAGNKKDDLLNLFDNSEFEKNLHLSKRNFINLFRSMRCIFDQEKIPLKTAKTRFFLALWKLTTDEHFERVAKRFNRTVNESQSLIRQLWDIVSSNAGKFIQWPSSNEATQKMRSHPQLKLLPRLFGVIVTKQIDVFFENLDEEVPVIWQLICNADLSIIDCQVEMDSNYNFNTTSIARQLRECEDAYLPNGQYLVGDRNFPLKSYLIRPFENPITDEEQYFNCLLEPAHNLAQKTLDTIAKRFHMLYALEAKNLAEVQCIITTICCLHNLCIEIDASMPQCDAENFSWAAIPPTFGGISNKKTHDCRHEDDVEGLERRRKIIKEIWN